MEITKKDAKFMLKEKETIEKCLDLVLKITGIVLPLPKKAKVKRELFDFRKEQKNKGVK
mgnify:CR=1 FL=1